MAFLLSPIANESQIDSNGDPLSGGFIETYLAGTSTPAPTYTDITGAVPQTNPIVLNTLGLPPSPVWLDSNLVYKFVIKDSVGIVQRTVDNIAGVSSSVPTQDQWVNFVGTPTFIGAASFSLAGDQTSAFQVGRRVRSVNTGGVVFSTILTSVFGAVTTITLRNDSGSLDAGLSQVSYGLISVTGTSIPSIINPAFIGDITMSGGAAVIFGNLNVAANATTSNIWDSNRVTLTGGAVTFTDFADAPQAGAECEVFCNAAHVFTNNANLIIDGGVNYTAAIGDRVHVRARSVSVFELAFLRVTPAATTTVPGTTAFATGAEVITGTNATKAVTPASLTTLQSVPASTFASGYITHPGGEIEQWGTIAGNVDVPAGGTTLLVSLPISFNFVHGCSSTLISGDAGGARNIVSISNVFSTTQIGFIVFDNGGGVVQTTWSLFYRAWGR